MYAHEWGEWKQTAAPTCTKAGEDARACAHDPSHTEKRVGAAATGHDWGEPVYAWADDCSSVTATRACESCGDREVETAAAASRVTREPTCSSKGETTYTATFKEEGFTAQSKSIENIDVDPDAHEWGAWTTTKAATEAEEGAERRVCGNDASHVETRAIPKLDPTKPDTPTEKVDPLTPAKKANPMKVAAKKTIKAKAAKATKIKKAITIKAAQGKVTIKTNNKKVKVAVKKNMKNGKTYKLKIAVKKGLKKGKTYKVKVRIKAAGNAKYKPATIKKTIRVKVR